MDETAKNPLRISLILSSTLTFIYAVLAFAYNKVTQGLAANGTGASYYVGGVQLTLYGVTVFVVLFIFSLVVGLLVYKVLLKPVQH